MGLGLSEPYNPTKRGPLTTHLANDLSRKKEIYKDVPFFHGAIQFTVYCYIQGRLQRGKWTQLASKLG